jgi:2-polyprenyl-3-methyl-5-hydroxy-6-metoxy-1,4-benzoquinol methylase
VITVDINTPGYWDAVYRREWESGRIEGGARDYAPIHDAIVELVTSGARVLDVACGPGLLCRKIALRCPGASVVGVDFSPYALERNRHRDHDLPVEYVVLDVRTELRSLRRTFDVVTMCEIVEHLAEPERVVADAMALLEAGGLFVLTCPHDDEIEDPEHLRLWGHDEVFHLLAPYGERVTFVRFPPPYYSPWLMGYLRKGA